MKKEKNNEQQNLDCFKLLRKISACTVVSQRQLANNVSLSLGKVNKIVKNLREKDYIADTFELTEKGQNYIKTHHPHRATILAAGYGLRMVPINTEEPKGLLEVNSEPLIERIIKQLHNIDITDISIVVGFMKEHYEYLIDQYNVKLIVNTHYDTRNNIYSLYLAKDRLANGYVIPCDIWFKNNPFSSVEDPSWYLFSDRLTVKSHWHVTKSSKVRYTTEPGNRMIGIAYLNESDAQKLSDELIKLVKAKKYDLFWEDALADKKKFLINGRIIPNSEHAEINSYEELLELDSNSSHLQNEAIQI
ncbi:NTP transferase domain-containing protein, partial [Lactobacillus helveticus]|uniref:NTP transferase domain-containing protein n=1 Tax=Lactobacillus helveticus TaxID=1587 RepID=UPI001562D63D